MALTEQQLGWFLDDLQTIGKHLKMTTVVKLHIDCQDESLEDIGRIAEELGINNLFLRILSTYEINMILYRLQAFTNYLIRFAQSPNGWEMKGDLSLVDSREEFLDSKLIVSLQPLFQGVTFQEGQRLRNGMNVIKSVYVLTLLTCSHIPLELKEYIIKHKNMRVHLDGSKASFVDEFHYTFNYLAGHGFLVRLLLGGYQQLFNIQSHFNPPFEDAMSDDEE